MPIHKCSVVQVQKAHQEEGHNESSNDADASDGVGIDAHVGLGSISIQETCPC